jgi:hypothetical protein
VEGTEKTLGPLPLLANFGKASANVYWMDLTVGSLVIVLSFPPSFPLLLNLYLFKLMFFAFINVLCSPRCK